MLPPNNLRNPSSVSSSNMCFEALSLSPKPTCHHSTNTLHHHRNPAIVDHNRQTPLLPNTKQRLPLSFSESYRLSLIDLLRAHHRDQ
ncbi:hypothetical protein M8C21_031625, partial [Ambrosia artemisiifolia]